METAMQSETAMAYDGSRVVSAMELMASEAANTQTEGLPWGLREEDMIPPFGANDPQPFAFCMNCMTRGHFAYRCPQYSKDKRQMETKLHHERMNARREKNAADWKARGRGRGYQRTEHETVVSQQYAASAQTEKSEQTTSKDKKAKDKDPKEGKKSEAKKQTN
jgi:hypothetical protein